MEVLVGFESIYVNQLGELMTEIKRASREAESNVEFLGMLESPLAKLTTCKTPSETTKCIPEIIQLCRVIWTNSPYLGNRYNMTRIFQVVGNSVISVCRQSIDLPNLFAGKTRETLRSSKECVRACEDLKSIYSEVCFLTVPFFMKIVRIIFNENKNLCKKALFTIF